MVLEENVYSETIRGVLGKGPMSGDEAVGRHVVVAL